MVLLLLSACSGREQDNLYITGAQKRAMKVNPFFGFTEQSVYYTPLMEAVRVKENIPYSENQKMDIYYPPAFNFADSGPVVIISNTLSGLDMKLAGRFIDWALILASHGMVAVTYNCVYAEKDMVDLILFLQKNAELYHINEEQIILFGFSGNCTDSIRILMNTDLPFSEDIVLAAYLFPSVPSIADIRTDVPIIIVRVEHTHHRTWNEAIDDLVIRSKELAVPLHLIDYREGHYGFDFYGSGESWIIHSQTLQIKRDIEVIDQVLELMQSVLEIPGETDI
jgi:hypothetical protein